VAWQGSVAVLSAHDSVSANDLSARLTQVCMAATDHWSSTGQLMD